MAFHHTFAVFTGLSNTGFNKIATKLVRRKLVMKNPPHTAHISHNRLKEWRLVLSGTRAFPLWTRRVLEGKYSLQFKQWMNRIIIFDIYVRINLKGHKSISIFSSLIPIHLLTTRLETLKYNARDTREARVQAQEVGVINLVRLSQGDTGFGYLVTVRCSNSNSTLTILLHLVNQYNGLKSTPGRHRASLVAS